MTDRPGGREMGGYLLLSYGTAWGIWLMCGMMPPGAVTAQLLNTVVDGIKEINDALNELHAAHLAIRDLTDEQEKANKYAHEIVPMMERLRAGVDAMEIVVAHDLWPVPTYNDIPGCRSPGCAALFWRISPGF